jgi:exodeoxyribonuclease VII small subunit
MRIYASRLLTQAAQGASQTAEEVGMAKKAQGSFEDALSRLEEIVHIMEDGKMTLDETSKLYEEGMRLAAFCKDKLNTMRSKVTMLTDEDGTIKEVNFNDTDD